MSYIPPGWFHGQRKTVVAVESGKLNVSASMCWVLINNMTGNTYSGLAWSESIEVGHHTEPPHIHMHAYEAKFTDKGTI